MKNTWLAAVTLVATAALVVAEPKNPNLSPLEDKVRHELIVLPYFSVFDSISFRVDGSTVTLFGAVTKPVLKSDAGNVVKRVEGVERVENQIEVLPLSSFDDAIRMQTARAIYGYPALQRYGLGTQKAIHIIVKNGNVTLVGSVSNDGDKQLAFMRANGVPGVFAVDNQLQIQK